MRGKNGNKKDWLPSPQLSLKEAAKHCKYSADYLRLRIRQGKLGGVKVGRDWVNKTTICFFSLKA